ncbi:hypothetical protein BOTBODRAFT_84841, partial [Botryobasidium botryosum FD-172 SS1]
ALARADTFERDFAVRWLTSFVSRASIEWFSSVTSEASDDEDSIDERERLLHDAALLLASCTDMPEAEETDILRTFSLDSGISIVLRDEMVGEDHTSVGLQTWGSSFILAKRMCQSPSSFGLAPHPSGRPLRILELGAGTGLLSLVATKILARDGISAHIVATDFHPSVLSNLEHNFSLNIDPEFPDGVEIHIRSLNWRSFHETTPCALDPVFAEPFDVILGGDLVYNTLHAPWIKSTVKYFLPVRKAGSDDPVAYFHLIMPLRPTYSAECDSVGIAFAPSATPYARELGILEIEEIERERGIGRADEPAYRLYKIGWS